MSIEYEQRITVNFPTTEAANKVKRQAKENSMSPSKWIIHQLEAVEEFQRAFAPKAAV